MPGNPSWADAPVAKVAKAKIAAISISFILFLVFVVMVTLDVNVTIVVVVLFDHRGLHVLRLLVIHRRRRRWCGDSYAGISDTSADATCVGWS
jgi:hypothetical protein